MTRVAEPVRRAAGRGVVALVLVLTAVALAAAPPATEGADCAPRVEVQEAGRTAALRAHRDDLRLCTVSEETYRRVLGEWLAARPDDADPLESVFLGRAVEYPWISEYLVRAALASSDWDGERGAPREGHENTFVAVLLSDPALHRRLAAPFEGTAYGIRSISVEKVLVDDAGERLDEVPGASDGAKVPYDAQVWILVARRVPTSDSPESLDSPELAVPTPPRGVRPD